MAHDLQSEEYEIDYGGEAEVDPCSMAHDLQSEEYEIDYGGEAAQV